MDQEQMGRWWDRAGIGTDGTEVATRTDGTGVVHTEPDSGIGTERNGTDGQGRNLISLWEASSGSNDGNKRGQI